MHVSALVHIVADVIAFATFPAFTVWVLFFLPPRDRGDDDDDLDPRQRDGRADGGRRVRLPAV
jgi:hypothetical protein